MAQHEGDLRAVRRLAGAQDDGDRLARRGTVVVDRLEAAAVVVGVEQRELMRTVDAVLGVVPRVTLRWPEGWLNRARGGAARWRRLRRTVSTSSPPCGCLRDGGLGKRRTGRG